MKKIQFLFIIALVAMMVSCKQEEQKADNQSLATEEKVAMENPQDAKLQKLRLGHELAMYGYKNNSAEALIEAANILADVFTESLKAECVRGEVENPDAEEKKAFEASMNPADILAKAKELAGEDANLLAMIQKVEAKMAVVDEGERGANLRPDGKVATSECPAGSWCSYTVEFAAGELAECSVIGDGDTDLDLFIYDQEGNLVAKDEDYTDNCHCCWIPSETSNYTLKIVNGGIISNKFIIAVN